MPQLTVGCCCISQAPQTGGTPIMPGTCRLASIKVSSAQLLFTSFVKKGKGIDRAASHNYTGQVEHCTGSSPHLRDGRTCLHQTPFSSSQSQARLGKREKNSCLHNIQPLGCTFSPADVCLSSSFQDLSVIWETLAFPSKNAVPLLGAMQILHISPVIFSSLLLVN